MSSFFHRRMIIIQRDNLILASFLAHSYLTKIVTGHIYFKLIALARALFCIMLWEFTFQCLGYTF